MWTLILSILGIVAIAFAMSFALVSPASDEAKRRRAPGAPSGRASQWDDAGSDRRNAK